MKKSTKIVLIILSIMVIAVPLGLLTDAPAWGEWDNEYYKKTLGFIPKGMENANSINPIIPDYSIGNNDVIGYYVSAIVGVILIYLVWFIVGKMVIRKKD